MFGYHCAGEQKPVCISEFFTRLSIYTFQHLNNLSFHLLNLVLYTNMQVASLLTSDNVSTQIILSTLLLFDCINTLKTFLKKKQPKVFYTQNSRKR